MPRAIPCLAKFYSYAIEPTHATISIVLEGGYSIRAFLFHNSYKKEHYEIVTF